MKYLHLPVVAAKNSRMAHNQALEIARAAVEEAIGFRETVIAKDGIRGTRSLDALENALDSLESVSKFKTTVPA